MGCTGKPTKAGDGLMRVTVSIPQEIDDMIRTRQVKTMLKNKKNQTYSKTVCDIVLESVK